MKILENHFKKYWPEWLGTLILGFVILIYLFTNNGVQVFHYDMIEQGIRFIQHGYRLLREPGLTLWDWNHYMGASIFSHGFYFIFSPFWLLFAILPDERLIPYVFLYVNILKQFLLFIFACLYFRKIRKSGVAIFAGASIFTFSGFALGYYNYSHFIDVFLFVPLILYFIEVYFKNGKSLGLVLSIAMIAIINPYLTILFTVPILTYALFRTLILKPKISIKELALDAFKFTILFLFGIGFSAVLFYPNISILLSSSRIQSTRDWLVMISKLDLFRYVTSFLQPIVDRNDFNPLISKTVVPSYGHSGGAAVYSLIITPLLVPLLLTIKTELRERLAILIYYIIFIIFALFPSFYFLIQGNNDTRWMVIFIIINAYSVTYIIDNRDKIKKIPLIVGYVILSVCLLGVYFYSRRLGLQPLEIYYDIAKRNIIIFAFITTAYTLLLMLKNRWVNLLLVLIITLDASLSLFNIFFNPVSSVSMDYTEVATYRLDDDSIVQTLNELDDGDYRIDVIENSGFNNPMSKSYMGFTFYSSVYNYAVDPFIQNNLSSGGGWLVGNNPGKWQYKMMFSSKYWYDLTGNASKPFGFKPYIETNYGNQPVTVFENQYFVPMFYTMQDELSLDVWLTLNSYDKMRSLMSNVIIENSSNKIANFPYPVEILSTFQTDYQHKFTEKMKDVIVTVAFPRSEEVLINLLLDGNIVDTHYSYEPQYSSLYSEVEFDEISVHVSNLYGVPAEEFVNTVYIEQPIAHMDDWYNEFKQSFPITSKLELNRFRVEINTESESWFVSSIAYDPDWNVTLNGERVDFQRVNGGFIGFKLPKGEYVIEGNFFPRKIIYGFVISLVSILGYFLIQTKRWI
jgi:uncharacterized membrane protein YfhO